jgi:hypothetical protein
MRFPYVKAQRAILRLTDGDTNEKRHALVMPLSGGNALFTSTDAVQFVLHEPAYFVTKEGLMANSRRQLWTRPYTRPGG